MKLIPRTRLGTWWRIALAAVIVIAAAAGTTAVAGLLQVKDVVDALKLTPPLKHITQLQLPAPGKPETLLLIGADHRTDEGTGYGNTDTMMLVRINDSSSTINLLSVPRDLEVTDPDNGISKLNAIYSSFGPNTLLKTLSHQVFRGLKVNHVVIVDFLGFSRLIDAINCVYTDVDHRYYNNTAQTDYSSINIQPGYQRLCGWDASEKGALAFVRFRHTDSDLVREARQQDFIRWAKQNYSTSDLIHNEKQLTKVFGKNAEVDKSLQTEDALLDLANLLINANGNTLKSVPFPVTSEPVIDGEDFIQSSATEEHKAFHQFMHPTPKPAAKQKTTRSGEKKDKHHAKHHVINTAGTSSDPGDGRSQASELSSTGTLGSKKLPIYYPTLIADNSDYCFTITENCLQYPNPSSEYKDSYPRRYTILAPNKKTRYASYVFTLAYGSLLSDDFYTIQGTTWRDPPLLRDPTGKVHVHGRTLHEFENGGKLSVVSFSTPRGVYWVANTLEDAVPNSQMLAIASSMVPAA